MSCKRSALTVLMVPALVVAMEAATFSTVRESVDEPESPPAAAQSTVTLTAGADATVREWAPDTNFGAEPSLELSYGGAGEEAVALVSFDLSGLPPDAAVDSASLRLYLESASGASPVTIAARAVTSGWDESAITWNAFPTVAEFGINASIDDEVGSYKSWPVTSLAQSWIDDPSSNYGVMLRGPTDDTNYERRFTSHEAGTNVPQLEVIYDLPAYTFAGHVYEGDPDDTSAPLEGVTVELWGDDDEWPEGGAERVLLASGPPTGPDGAFLLEWDRATEWPYLHVIESDPDDAISTGAVTGPPGSVTNYNVVTYRYDDLLETGLHDFGGIAFWDRFPAGPPDLTVTDIWAEGDHICFRVQNIGATVAPADHQAALTIDGDQQASLTVGVELASTATWDGCFDYNWICSGEGDTIVVRADATDVVAESDETNNRREEIWACDVTPPQIVSGPMVSDVTPNSAVISWETDEAADSAVRYDANARAYGHEETDPVPTTNHHVTLDGLKASTTYHYVASSTDPAGNSVESQDLIFQTAAASDTRDPTVNLSVPAVMTGTVAIRADADDDTGVHKVEFYLDDELAFTDYSPPYEWPFDTSKHSNGLHNLGADVYDQVGKKTTQAVEADIANAIDASTPKANITYPAQDDVTVYGEINVVAQLSDDVGLAQAFFKVSRATGEMHAAFVGYPNHPKSATESFEFDTTEVPNGSYRLGVMVFDTEGNVGYGVRDVIVNQAAAPKPAQLKVIRHTLTRKQNRVIVNLVVRNVGDETASDVRLEDTLRGFQPINATVWTPSAARNSAVYNPGPREATCKITGNADIAAGWVLTYTYTAIPVLHYPNPPTPAVGSTTRLHYERPDGTTIHDLATVPLPQATAVSAYDAALKAADYLIVTHPARLFGFNFPQTEAVDSLLSDMAELAVHRQGALGYLGTYDRDVLHTLIIPNQFLLDFIGWDPFRPGVLVPLKQGPWAQRLHPNFRTVSAGYLLIVGESEIVPSWSTYGWNRHWAPDDNGVVRISNRVDLTDRPYADIGGKDPAPELIVSRIIGDNATELATPIRTSIAVHEGQTGHGFDRSDALLVSGTGVGQATVINGVNLASLTALAQGFTPTILHLSNYPSGQRLTQIQNRTPGRDVIYVNEHGNASCLGPICFLDVSTLNFGGTNPIILAPSCLTGDYKNGSVAEKFFDHEAGLYFGATELSPVPHNAEFGLRFFSTWDAHETAGKALTDLQRERWSHGTWWQFWVEEYNTYGDPKYGAAPHSALTALDAQKAKEEPISPVEVVVPDYEVTTVDDFDFATIPGGDLLYEEGQPQVPYYTVSYDYEPGYQVQDVGLVARGDVITETGLALPITTMDCMCASQTPATPASPPADAWYPDREIDWDVQQNPDGSVTLLVMLYPFSYNAATTDAEFYKEHTLEIAYTYSDVSVAALAADQNTYQTGDVVAVDLVVKNAGTAARDVVVSAHVERYGSGQVLEGLVLQTLSGLEGPASYATQWDSSGADAGLYAVNVTLKDTAGNILDSESTVFGLGVAAGEVTGLTVTPHHFRVGDTVDASLVFENTGSLELTGTAVLEVRDEDGTPVDEFEQAFSDLAPGETVTLDATWDTAGVTRGDYTLLGYARYDGMATQATTVTVSTERRIYLPLTFRGS